MSRKRVALLGLAALIAAVAAYLLLRPSPTAEVRFQGYVEGNLVYLAPEEAGRIESLGPDVGANVGPGEQAFALEASMQRAQRNEAAARLGQAKATLENLQAAQQRPEQIAVLQATQERAGAALELSRRNLERQQALFDRGVTTKAALDQAEGAFRRDTAALEEAKRQIGAAKLAGRSAEIEAAEAAMRAAEATLAQAESRLRKREVAVPVPARVQDVYFRPGEVVNAGQPVLAILPPENLKIRFYVPEPSLARMTLGGRILVTCDGCAEPIEARVTFISSEAEFTPPVIFSQQERTKLVFKLEAKPTTDRRLPLGLPVDVRPAPEPSGEARTR